MRRRTAGVVAMAIALGASNAPPATAAEPVKVLGTTTDETNPAASTTHLAWDAWNGSVTITFAKPFDGPRMRVSLTGWSGSAGAFDGAKLVYQQYSNERGVSDLYVFNVVRKRRIKLPSIVNSREWEYHPSMSGDIVAFARWYPNHDRKLLVYDRSTRKLRTIATSSGKNRYMSVGQVAGNWLVFERTTWTRDRTTSCDVFRYNLAARTTTKIPNPDGTCQWGGSVDTSGTTYFARSGFGCGLNVSLRAHPIGGPVSTLADIPSGRDIGQSYAVDNGDGTAGIYYDGGRCTKRGYGPGDIYRIDTGAP